MCNWICLVPSCRRVLAEGDGGETKKSLAKKAISPTAIAVMGRRITTPRRRGAIAMACRLSVTDSLLAFMGSSSVVWYLMRPWLSTKVKVRFLAVTDTTLKPQSRNQFLTSSEAADTPRF